MIVPFLKRRLWLTQQRLFSTLGMAFLLPLLLHVSINIPMRQVVVRTIRNIPYQQWVFPGMLMILAVITLIPLLYREFFDLRIYKKGLPPITLTPLTKYNIIISVLFTAILESLVFIIFGMIVFTIIMDVSFVWYDYLIMLFFLFLSNCVLGNLIVTVALLTERVTMFMILVITIFCFLLFGSGLLIEFEFFPVMLGTTLQLFPTSMLITGLRMLIFTGIINWTYIIVPCLIIIIWTSFNSELLRRKLNQ